MITLIVKYFPEIRFSGGENVSLKCPFHKDGKERRPSFSINTRTGVSYCYTCHRGWNMFTLLIEMGIPKDIVINELSSIGYVRETGKKIHEEIILPDSILHAYRWCPVELVNAGFHKEVLKEYEIGYDTINDRITCPIRNENGELVGILGRNLPDRPDRYYVYEKELSGFYPKEYSFPLHDYLWNAHRIDRKTDTLILTEGFKKALWFIQHGYPSALSLNWSSMSVKQKLALDKIRASKIVLALDGDDAGKRGVKRIFDLYCGTLVMSVPEYPIGKTQPDELTQEELDIFVKEAKERRFYYEYKH